jgi:Sulfotransferase domain
MLMLQVVGAGLPRTGTHSLKLALSSLLGGDCLHMTSIPGHPFDLGPVWGAALAHGRLDVSVVEGFVACVDWPASMFWQQLSERYPEAVVLLSKRGSADEWWQSMEATILPYARLSQSDSWTQGRDLATLLERFTGTPLWDDRTVLSSAYERHIAAVQDACDPARLVVWMPTDGWTPICRALGLPEPGHSFPVTNRREEWRKQEDGC